MKLESRISYKTRTIGIKSSGSHLTIFCCTKAALDLTKIYPLAFCPESCRNFTDSNWHFVEIRRFFFSRNRIIFSNIQVIRSLLERNWSNRKLDFTIWDLICESQ